MKHGLLFWFCCVFLGLFSQWSSSTTLEPISAPPLQLPLAAEQAPLAGHLAVWLDSVGSATFEQAQTQNFVPVAGNINLGHQPGVLWVRMQVQRDLDAPSLRHRSLSNDWWLEVAPAFLDELTLWISPPPPPKMR